MNHIIIKEKDKKGNVYYNLDFRFREQYVNDPTEYDWPGTEKRICEGMVARVEEAVKKWFENNPLSEFEIEEKP